MDDREDSVYQYVPFDVAAAARSVSVRLEYDRSRAVLDLGVFDPEGFRGYSGGAREEFVVTTHAATPGYLPGPLVIGQWQVLIGLYRVPPEGIDATLRIKTGTPWPIHGRGADFSPPPPSPRGSSRQLPAAPGRRWVAGDLHAHTIHSDGALSVDQLAGLAARRGLDFLAVTDHNTTSHHPHLPDAGRRAGVVLLPGQEVTTDSGHANCFGDVGWVDFRRHSDDWVEHARQASGLLSINHPVQGEYRWRRALSTAPDLAEVWHWSWDRRSDEPLRWWRARGGVAVGGSDWHRPGETQVLGCPTTWVEVERDDDVLPALQAGRASLSTEPHGPVAVWHEGELVVDGGAGLTLMDGDGRRRPVTADRQRMAAGPGPHLLVDDDQVVHALAQRRS